MSNEEQSKEYNEACKEHTVIIRLETTEGKLIDWQTYIVKNKFHAERLLEMLGYQCRVFKKVEVE